MTTAANLIAETEAHVLGAVRDERNRLSAAMADTTSTTVSLVNALNGIKAGAIIAIDLEEMFVESVNAAAQTATVIRGDNGSTPATHLNNSVVYVNPQASKFRILRAINNDLRSLSSPRNGLFGLGYVDLTYSNATRGYDLTGATGMIGEPLSVLAQSSDTVGADWIPLQKWRFYASVPTSVFASGFTLQLDQPGDNGKTIRVVYRKPFVELAALADDVVATALLPATATDLPPLGAAIEILAARAQQRATLASQGDPRRDVSVGTNDTINAPTPLVRVRMARIAEEVARLTALYPMRVHR